MEGMKPSLDEARAWISLIAEKGWPDDQVAKSLAAEIVRHRLEGVTVALAAVRDRGVTIAALEATRMALLEENDDQVAESFAAKFVRHRLEGVTVALDAVRSIDALEAMLLASVNRT